MARGSAVNFMFRLCVVAFLFTAFAAAPAFASPPEVVAEGARSVPGGRTIQVIVAQAEIQSNINRSRIAQAAGGGMLMALIDASVEQSRAKKAEAAITPLREALAGFDAEALAKSTTTAIVEAAPWLGPVAVSFGKDSSLSGKSTFLDAAGAEQVAFFEYTYDLSANFDAVRVKLLIQFANRALPESKGKTPKPESRLSDRNLAYSQTIVTMVALASPSEEIEQNVPRWSTDNAAPARAALTAAFKQVARFAPRALALTEADLKAMKGKDRKRMAVGEFGGRQQPDAEPGTLIWGDEGFAYIQTADATPAEAPPAAAPATEATPAEAPPAEAPPAEAPPAETPPAETPPAETPPAETAPEPAPSAAPAP